MSSSHALLADFKRALDEFDQALRLPPENNVVRAGCIQYFEFTFELAWKAIKRLAQEEGIADCNSPRSALRAAFANHWIDHELLWLEMLEARNRMAHTYNAANALDVYQRLPLFLPEFQKLAITLSDKMTND